MALLRKNLKNISYSPPSTGGSGIADGTSIGKMLHWDGTAWTQFSDFDITTSTNTLLFAGTKPIMNWFPTGGETFTMVCAELFSNTTFTLGMAASNSVIQFHESGTIQIGDITSTIGTVTIGLGASDQLIYAAGSDRFHMNFTGTHWNFDSQVNGSNIVFQSESAAGANRLMCTMIPEGAVQLSFDGTVEAVTKSGGFVVDEIEIQGDLNHDGTNIGFYGTAPAAVSSAYTRNATIVEDRTLLQSSAATAINNNNVLAALIADLQAIGLIA